MADRNNPAIAVPENGVSVVVLGIMQDGGLPHAGCRCRRCMAAVRDPGAARRVASLAVVDTRPETAQVWLIDATPDIGAQLLSLSDLLGPHPRRRSRLRQPAGIFLTHAHLGHIGGLPQLGPEAMSVVGLPVYASPGLVTLLRESSIWRPATANFIWHPRRPNSRVPLAPGLTITPLAVPHRDEWGVGTYAYLIAGPERSLLYVPDIDAWSLWPAAREYVAAVDLAVVDASFFSADELGGRPPVAHPLVPDTLAYFGDLSPKLVLTHINHTNPLLDAGSEAQQAVADAGAAIAQEGQVWLL